MKNIFVFFHSGENIIQPSMLVKSIIRTNPNSEIIQCSDKNTPKIDHVTSLEIFDGNIKNLMSYRISAFAELKIMTPAIYLDTDMLVVKKIDINEILGNKEVLLCNREFDVEKLHTGALRGVKFPEHHGVAIGKVYPYVACSTISKNYFFWNEIKSIILSLDERFHIWYGDQEAMKIWAKNQDPKRYGELPESKFGCLPEKNNDLINSNIIHFKGQSRKNHMVQFFNTIFK